MKSAMRSQVTAVAPPPRWVAGLLLALFLSNGGTFLQTTAQAWLAWQMTGSAAFLGLLGLVQATPLLGVSLLGGLLADRFARRSLLLLSQTALAGIAALIGGLALAGAITPSRLLILAGVLAAVAAVDNPIRQVYLLGVVAPSQRGRVVGLNALAYNAGAVAGPALAGVLLPTVGVGWAFLLNGVSYLVVLGLVIVGPAGRPVRIGRGALSEALGYIRHSRRVLHFFLLVAGVSLLGRSYVHVLPAVVADAWGGGVRTYGALAAVPGIGALVAAAVVTWLLGRPRHARLPAIGALLLGGVVIGLGLAPTALAAVGDLILVGAAATGTMTLLNAGLQLATPDAVRGRVLSFYTWLAAGLPALGGWLLGVFLAATGPRPALVSAGVGLVLLTLFLMIPVNDQRGGDHLADT